MKLGVRRLLAVVALGVAFLIGTPGPFAGAAPASSQTPAPSSKAHSTTSVRPSATSTVGGDDTSGIPTTPDVAPDNSRTIWLLGGAGIVAVAAAAIVIARR